MRIFVYHNKEEIQARLLSVVTGDCPLFFNIGLPLLSSTETFKPRCFIPDELMEFLAASSGLS